MADELADLRRVVTTHDEKGAAIIQSDTPMPTELRPPGVKAGAIWVTVDGLPSKDNNSSEDGGNRKLEGLNLVQPKGTNFRYTDLGPGNSVAMHRTSSIDYNVLIQGELILILDDGSETHLKNPGDVVIQRGTVHGWRNPGTEWTRWVCVLIDAEPAIVNGKSLEPGWDLPAGA